MNKKEREKSILKLIYPEEEFAEIIGSEEPDFRIQHSGMKTYFGVEITEFYYSEANARLRNIPTYLTELLNERRFRHKQDKKELDVGEVSLISDDKPEQKIMGVRQSVPEISQFIQMVSDTISNKSQKFENYRKGLTHVNLIVFDLENRLYGLPAKYFYRYFFGAPIKDSICNSRFREIYFITLLAADKWVYIPLRMLILLSEYKIFSEVVYRYFPELNFLSAEDELSLFAQYLIFEGTQEIYLHKDNGTFEVIYGNSGICLLDETGITIRDHKDYDLPGDAKLAEHKSNELFASGIFHQRVNELLEQNTFITELVFDVRDEVVI